jgi:hypothetical protein
VDRVDDRLLTAVADLDPGAGHEGDEKEPEEGWNREAKPGFVLFEPAISRVRDRSRDT